MLVDTSAIIDGRIGDIVATGFVDGELVIPVFVLRSCSGWPTRPIRSAAPAAAAGSRWCTTCGSPAPGLDARVDGPGARRRGRQALRLAQERDLPILTTDYNLNKVAQIQGVQVLNVNELANALKPAVLPGEALRVKVIREGKEAEQGVGYLDDGTMIVVEGGREPHRRARGDGGHERAAVAQRQDDLHPAGFLSAGPARSGPSWSQRAPASGSVPIVPRRSCAWAGGRCSPGRSRCSTTTT